MDMKVSYKAEGFLLKTTLEVAKFFGHDWPTMVDDLAQLEDLDAPGLARAIEEAADRLGGPYPATTYTVIGDSEGLLHITASGDLVLFWNDFMRATLHVGPGGVIRWGLAANRSGEAVVGLANQRDFLRHDKGSFWDFVERGRLSEGRAEPRGTMSLKPLLIGGGVISRAYKPGVIDGLASLGLDLIPLLTPKSSPTWIGLRHRQAAANWVANIKVDPWVENRSGPVEAHVTLLNAIGGKGSVNVFLEALRTLGWIEEEGEHSE